MKKTSIIRKLIIAFDEQEAAIYAKKNEICVLEEKVTDLEENLDNTKWMLTKKQEELDEERR